MGFGRTFSKKSQKKVLDNTVLNIVGEVKNVREYGKSSTGFAKVNTKSDTFIFFLFLNIRSHS